jgi:hypothetical protein
MFTNISKELAASIFISNILSFPEYGGNSFLQNVGNIQPGAVSQQS